MTATRFAAMLVAEFLLCNAALAITIPTVLIGTPSNSADTRYIDSQNPNGVGAVGYTYRIGTTEVTNVQYVEFLNAVAANDVFGLYDSYMTDKTWGGIVRSGTPGNYRYSVKPAVPSGTNTYAYDDKPVDEVTWFDALRFTNWLHNGQPVGAEDTTTTEDGAYTFSGATTVSSRNAGARWFLPSEDEWYKAAYYDPNATTYYDYPTRSNSVPNNNAPFSTQAILLISPTIILVTSRPVTVSTR